MKKEAIRVVAMIPAAPTTLYYAWLSSEQHSAMTGGAAKIDPTVGAKFSAVNGLVSGKLVILDLGRRLVMSWRTTDFPRDAHDSRVEINLEALGGSTRVTLIQTELPEGQGEKARSIWNESYFGPMRAFFSKFLPDPRNPPPPRRPQPPPDEDEEEEEEEPPTRKVLKGGKPATARPISAKPVVIAKPAPPPPPPAKPAKPEKKAPPPPEKPAKPAKAAKTEPKPAKKAAKPAPKPAKKPAAKKATPKPAKKAAKPVAKPKKKKK